MLRLREQIRSWRFYDHFRTDADAPARLPQIGTHTPVLGHDGADLAAAIQTIREIGDAELLDRAVDDAFPGARLTVTQADGRFEIEMHQHGLLRPLKAGELSDGTLRYLLWIAALLTPRPPTLMVLNEPETSLHPDLLPALGAPDCAGRGALAGIRGVACLAAGRHARGRGGLQLDRARQGVRRNPQARGGQVRRAGVALGGTLIASTMAYIRRRCYRSGDRLRT